MDSSTIEPTISSRGRSIEASWPVYTSTDEYTGREVRHLAVLRASHAANARCYVATLGRETEEDSILDGRRIGTTRGYFMFSSKRVARSEPVARFSQKRLQEFFDSTLAAVEQQRAEEPAIAAVFDPNLTDAALRG